MAAVAGEREREQEEKEQEDQRKAQAQEAEDEPERRPHMRSSALGRSWQLCMNGAPPGPAALCPSPSREPPQKRSETVLGARRDSLPPLPVSGELFAVPGQLPGPFPGGGLPAGHVTLRDMWLVREHRGLDGNELSSPKDKPVLPTHLNPNPDFLAS